MSAPYEAPEPAIPEHVAKADLANRCSRCGCRIDHGDRYRIIGWGGGWDYEHVDCSQSAFKTHVRGKHE